jgi:hypothetical protein
MQTLSIKATSLESARGFCVALSGFQAELIKAEDGTHLVNVALDGSDKEIIAVLNALESYVTHRGDGPAEVDLDGQNYKLYPT